MRKTQTQKKHAPMAIVETSSPMEKLATDILGELPETENGNRYILVVSDYYTKWTESFPMPNMEASTVVKIIVEERKSGDLTYKVDCGIRGSPQIIHADRIQLKHNQMLRGEMYEGIDNPQVTEPREIDIFAVIDQDDRKGGCFYHTDKSKNLLRHMKSKHQKEDDSNSDKEANTSKSKDLLSDSSEFESEDDWKRQDPGDILGQESDEIAHSEKETKKDTELKESENKKDDSIVNQMHVLLLGPEIMAVGSKSIDAKGLSVDNPDKQTDNGKSKVNEKDSVALCATCKKRKVILVACGVQTDSILYARTVTTVTTYRDGPKKIRIVEAKEAY
ncbi:unnamed protein product [Mytilus coruscus]|uniref:Integrase catalytic domain-containing protein n=1 Tax=Mytilus coruscus TaxID=42192 RepID=A0A6J8CGM0_MYTCO|nr:unnamed protein product [Mytilus coruscus]